MNPALLSSTRQDWRTPPKLLKLVQRVGKIGLDPCASQNSSEHFAAENLDAFGLELPWGDSGLVYCNPPYGRGLPKWIEKAIEEGRKMRGRDQLVLLVAARPDTRWFAEVERASAAVAFWQGRITFVGAPHPAPFPSALAYFGDHVDRFRRAFLPFAWIHVRESTP